MILISHQVTVQWRICVRHIIKFLDRSLAYLSVPQRFLSFNIWIDSWTQHGHCLNTVCTPPGCWLEADWKLTYSWLKANWRLTGRCPAWMLPSLESDQLARCLACTLSRTCSEAAHTLPNVIPWHWLEADLTLHGCCPDTVWTLIFIAVESRCKWRGSSCTFTHELAL